MVAMALGGTAAQAVEAGKTYSVWIMLTLQINAADAAGRDQVVGVEAQRRKDQPANGGAEFESDQGQILRAINGSAYPYPFARTALLQQLPTVTAQKRRFAWLDADLGAAPGVQITYVCIQYRYTDTTTAYQILLTPASDPATPGTSLVSRPWRTTPAVSLQLPGARLGNPAFVTVAETAAQQVLDIAGKHQAGPGAPLPSADNAAATAKELREHFLLSRYSGPQLYRVREPDGRLDGIDVNPVFIPSEITCELVTWKAYEAQKGLSPARVEALRKKRTEREAGIRKEFEAVIYPAGTASPVAASPVSQPVLTGDRPVLVTEAILQQWANSEPGRAYAPVFDHMDGTKMVLTVSDKPTVVVLDASIGGSYRAEEGLQANGSVAFSYDRYVNTSLSLKGAYGRKADSLTGSLGVIPSNRVLGWTLDWENAGSRERNDEKLFDGLNGGQSVHWKTSHLETTLAARHPAATADEGAGPRWSTDLAATLTLSRDDSAIREPVALPGTATAPGSKAGAGFEFRSSRPVAALAGTFSVQTRVEVTRGLASSGQAGRFTRVEGSILVSHLMQPKGGLAWKEQAEFRRGTIWGQAPLDQQFQAGGDGWLRGFHAGELTGSDYTAGSLAAGPDISALFGGKADAAEKSAAAASAGPTSPKPYLLLFVDAGRVGGRVGAPGSAARTAYGYGLEINFDQLPVSATAKADLSLGYAYSPDSRIEPHGTFFVRLDFPLVK